MPETVDVEEGEGLEVALAVMLAVGEPVGVMEGLAPPLRAAVGEALRVLLALTEELGVGAPLPVPVVVGLAVPVTLGVGGGVAEPERLVEAEFEGVAPRVSEGVGLLDTVELALTVEVGVTLPVLVPVPVPVLLGVCEAV